MPAPMDNCKGILIGDKFLYENGKISDPARVKNGGSGQFNVLPGTENCSRCYSAQLLVW